MRSSWPASAWPSSATARSCRAAASARRASTTATASRWWSRSVEADLPPVGNDRLIIAGKSYDSRLLVGTGKYRDFDETRRAIEASGARIVTVAIRRTNIGQNAGEPNLLDVLPPSRFTILPNTAGCYHADDALRPLRLAPPPLHAHS